MLDFEEIKFLAKKHKDVSGLSLCQCLDLVVKALGFNSMAHYRSVYPRSSK